MESEQLANHLSGVLLGTALGDALGLYMEGLSAQTIATRFTSGINRYYLLGNVGFVSDDTEQAALVAQSLVRHADDSAACARAFQLSMGGWFLRMPFGVGRATSFACLRILTGAKDTGIRSGGNGAAMRSAIIGLYFHDDREKRIQFVTKLARVTHIDTRAVEGALFVAEMAAAAFANRHGPEPECRFACFDSAIDAVMDDSLRNALMLARELVSPEVTVEVAYAQLGSSGFVNHTVPLAAFCFLRYGKDSLKALQAVIGAGGDTDTNAAIVGAWCGAMYGEGALPQDLLDQINNGPFGPSHLRALAAALAASKSGTSVPVPSYFWPFAFLRNVAIIPVILTHAFARLLRGWY